MVKSKVDSESKNKLLILFSVLSFFMVILGIFYVRKVANKIKFTRVNIEEAKNDLNALERVMTEDSQYKEDINKILESLPSEYYQLSYFTTYIEGLARDNNINVNLEIDSEKREDKSNYNSLLYAIETTGSFIDISRFLTQISKTPYHTTIESMEIKKDEEQISANVKFELYMSK